MGGNRRIAGHFDLGEQVSAGSSCSLYRAVDTRDQRVVALKLFRGSNPIDQERLAREARTLAAMHSPHVVRYIEHGTLGRRGAYLALEWLAGEDLARRQESRPLSV